MTEMVFCRGSSLTSAPDGRVDSRSILAYVLRDLRPQSRRLPLDDPSDRVADLPLGGVGFKT